MFADRKRPGVSEARRPAQAAGPSRGEKRDDALEAQAERIAAHAMSGPGYAGAPVQPVSRAGPRDGEAPIAHAADAAHAEGRAHDPAHDPALAGTGAPLAAGVRADMERRIGFDFSTVRIHNGAAAARSAQSLSAQAYTFGPNIVFGAGQFAPHTAQGRHLLAHELVHVAQQAGSPRVQRKPTDPDELAQISKEDEALTALAKRALASGKPELSALDVMWRLVRSRRLDTHFELRGSRYDKTIKGVSVQLEGKGPSTAGVLVAGDDALKQVAQGKVEQVAAELEKQIGLVSHARGGVDLVFIMGKDNKKSNNHFYTEALIFFKKAYPGTTPIEDVRTLDGIIKRVNEIGKPVANLIIVSHAHPDGTLQFVLDEEKLQEAAAKKDPSLIHLQYSDLKAANALESGEKGALTTPDKGLIGFWTNVLIRGCNLGRSEEMLGEVRTAFGGQARVIAPTHGQRYGGGAESLADPFYEEPGASKLSNKEALKRIEAKPEYGFVTDWGRMEKALKRTADKTNELVYDGVFPASGQEMAFLKHMKPKERTSGYTFEKSFVDGDKTVFEFMPPDNHKQPTIPIDAQTPPTDDEAIKQARERTARPDAYTYKVRRARSGLKLKVSVDVERTEWTLHHQGIRKRGQPFNPSPGAKPWFGDTEY